MLRRIMKIRNIPTVLRPREKLLRYGPDRLSEDELMAVILGTGIKGEGVLELSHRIMIFLQEKQFHENISAEEVSLHLGIGKAKACSIVACIELGKRLTQGKKSR